MRLDDFHFLLSPEGRNLLAVTAAMKVTPETHLQLAAQLGRQVGPERAHALLETVLLRQRAVEKFSRASKMYFTRAALEQASAEVVASHRARRFVEAGFRRLADLGCGIGGDSLALAASAEVIGVDRHPLRLSMAQENVRIYGHGEQFWPLQADLLELEPLPVEAIFADPGRRDLHGRRARSVEAYQPPLGALDRWRERVPHQGIKVSPAVDYAELPVDAEVEFISVKGEVREGMLWLGRLRSACRRRATLLPEGHTMIDEPVAPVEITRPRAFLYEPDGAVIRAHLVVQLACRLEASQLDADIAYLTADHALPTPFARCYALEDSFAFQLKRLRHYLRDRNIGQVVIKKRGSPLNPDALRRRLRLKGPESRIIFLTRVQGEPTVLVGRRQT